MARDGLTDNLPIWDPKYRGLAYNNTLDRTRIELPPSGDPGASGVVQIDTMNWPSGVPVNIAWSKDSVTAYGADPNAMPIHASGLINIQSASGTSPLPVYLDAPIPVAVHVDIETDAIKVYSASGTANLPVYLTSDLDFNNDSATVYGADPMARPVHASGLINVQSASGDPAVDVHLVDAYVTETNSAAMEAHLGNINTDADKLAEGVYVDNFIWTDDTSKNYLIGGVYNGNNTITAGHVGPIALNASGVVLVDYPTVEHTWDQLTAPGVTASLYARDNSKHTFQYTIANINTSVDVTASGSLDNTNWFNLDANDALTTETSNGTYGMTFDGMTKYVLFAFMAETGGTSAIITPRYLGGH